MVSVCSNGKHTEELRAQGYRVESIAISRSTNVINHIKSIYHLYKFFKANSFDIVHVHTPIAAMVGRLAAWLARVPIVIYTAHGFYFHDDMNLVKKGSHIFLERILGSITDLLFTQSEEDAESAVEYRIAANENVYAIGNGVDIQRFSPAKGDFSNVRENLGIPSEAFVVGMIARLVKEKGVEEFLEAALELDQLQDDCYFLLVGERQEHDHAKGVEAAIESSKKVLGKRLILTGYRSDTPQLLSAMNLFVLPSWREGMPRSIIEAMMMGLPVVATNIRGSREEVIPNETGLIVAVRSAPQLAAAILKCIKNPKWAIELGVKGRRRALQYYDERKVVEFQLEIIEKYKQKRCD